MVCIEGKLIIYTYEKWKETKNGNCNKPKESEFGDEFL